MTEQEPKAKKNWRQRLAEIPVQAALPGFPVPFQPLPLEIVKEAVDEMERDLAKKSAERWKKIRQRRQAALDRGEPDLGDIVVNI